MSYKTPTNLMEMQGTWSIEDGYLVITMTNLVGMDRKEYGESTQRYKIAQIGSKYWTFHLHNGLATMLRQ